MLREEQRSTLCCEYYLKALTGSPEKRKPSLYVNLGTALLGTKDYENALEAFGRALDYPIYTTPYKAYAGIGAAQLKLGNMVEAGAAYREAALDPANPAPAKSLVNLGVCFMELGRPEDAVSVYETALDFDLDDRARAKAYANLGQAYMAQGRVPRALNAFEKAEEIGGELPSLAMHDYEIARTLKERVDSRAPGILDTGYIPPVATDVSSPEDDEDFDPFAPRTDADQTVPWPPIRSRRRMPRRGRPSIPPRRRRLPWRPCPSSSPTRSTSAWTRKTSSRGLRISSFPRKAIRHTIPVSTRPPSTTTSSPVTNTASPLTLATSMPMPAKRSMSWNRRRWHMPSPEDTAFFDISEQQINSNARKGMRRDRRARGCGLKIAIVFVVICILIAAAACVAYVLGYGYPLQETVTEDFFAAVQDDGDTSQYWAKDVSPSMQRAQEASLTDLSSYSVEAVQRSMNQTAVFVKATLAQGGNIDYEVVLTRDGISWAIQFVQLYFPSEQ